MPAVPAVTLRFTPQEYFDRVAEQDEKHEYYDGEVFAMAGGSSQHALISANLIAELRAAVRPQGCSAHSSDLRVQLTEDRRYVYPDATVVCGTPEFLDDDGMTLVTRRSSSRCSPGQRRTPTQAPRQGCTASSRRSRRS